jgi:uncharacterized membrane protein YfcA
MLNFKNAEPFSMLKNLKDLRNEHHNHAWKWAKAFFFGAVVGAFVGYSWFVIRPF